MIESIFKQPHLSVLEWNEHALPCDCHGPLRLTVSRKLRGGRFFFPVSVDINRIFLWGRLASEVEQIQVPDAQAPDR